MATLRPLYQPSLMQRYLIRSKVLLKDFAGFASAWTERVRTAAHRLAERLNRPLTYLHGSSERKELLARDLARQDSLSSGLIGIWSVVEPCLTYFVRRDRQQKKLVLRLEPGKCLHYYFYFLHEQLGLLHLRLQTWFPFAIHACINGRHWLGRQMDQSGIDYLQRENCFTWIKDLPKAQALCRAQLESRWPILLQPLIEQCHPHWAEITQPLGLSYYWSVTESEYATDVMFKSSNALKRLYPALVHQGIKHFGSTDVLRFLGHKAQANGRVHGNHQGEVLSSLKGRPEGLRLKHQANGNSIKLYDKQGSVLRVETTMNVPTSSGYIEPANGILKARRVGRFCAKESVICTDARRSARRLTVAIWKPWPVCVPDKAPENWSKPYADRFSRVNEGIARLILGRNRMQRCWSLSIVVSGP